MRYAGVAVVVCLTFASLPIDSYGQQVAAPGAELRARWLATPPTLDGVLDDEAWAGDPIPLTGWMSYNPLRGEPARKKRRSGSRTTPKPSISRSAVSTRSPGEYGRPSAAATTRSATTGSGSASIRAAPASLPITSSSIPAASRWTRCKAARTARTWRPIGSGTAPATIGSDGWSAEIRVPLENIRFRSGANIRMGVLFWRRLSRTGVSTSWPEIGPGEVGVRFARPVAFDDAAVAPPARVHSKRDVLEQSGAERSLRVGWHAVAGRFRREREIRRHLADHARRDGQSRFQPGRKRRVRSGGEPAVPGVLQREAAVLHGRHGSVQHRRHRRRFDDANRRSHADDHRSERRLEADGRRGPPHLRRAVVGRCRAAGEPSGSSRSAAKS